MKAKIYIFSTLALGVLAWTIFPKSLFATESPARCYDFTFSNSPASEINPEKRIERWCYQSLSSPTGSVYVYNADASTVRPELAMVRAQDGVLTHGSLVADKVTLHSLQSKEFNPFPVPLEEPRNMAPAAAAAAESSAFRNSAQTVLDQLLSHRSELASFRFEEGQLSAASAQATQPWRGYWWPNKGLPMVGPLTKYDRYVTARSGSPSSVAWEKVNHRSHGLWWEGHCNGWAAAAILRSEPKSTKRDSRSGVSFSVSDQKGLLAEVDFCASATMFGNRYDGRGRDTKDINPVTFHKTLLYYIGQLRKPVVMDYHADAVVDNHVVSGYTMNIRRRSGDSYDVTTVLRVHRYDGFRTDRPGIAPTYTRTYRYTIRQDSGGNISSGTWRSENPDFLWIPLGTGRCSSGNPRVSNTWTVDILGR